LCEACRLGGAATAAAVRCWLLLLPLLLLLLLLLLIGIDVARSECQQRMRRASNINSKEHCKEQNN